MLFNELGQTVTYPLLHIDGNQVFFTENFNGGQDYNANGILDRRDVPNEFGTPVRVLLPAQRINDFRWMLNVRRSGDGGVRSVDIVVKLSDGVDPTEERGFNATFIRNSNQVGVIAGTDGMRPNIRKGKFVFDANNGLWYRISDVIEDPGNGYDFQVTLETAAVANSGSDSDDGLLNGSDTGSFGFALFPKGIVDIYPTGPRDFPTR